MELEKWFIWVKVFKNSEFNSWDSGLKEGTDSWKPSSDMCAVTHPPACVCMCARTPALVHKIKLDTRNAFSLLKLFSVFYNGGELSNTDGLLKYIRNSKIIATIKEGPKAWAGGGMCGECLTKPWAAEQKTEWCVSTCTYNSAEMLQPSGLVGITSPSRISITHIWGQVAFVCVSTVR